MPNTPHAPELGVECPHCGEVHHRCVGHYERGGGPKPCGRVGSNDTDKCFRHGGGNAPPARARARRRAIKPRSKAMSKAIAILNELGVPIQTDPLDALRDQVAESAGIVSVLRANLQKLKIPDVTDPKDAAGGYDKLWHASMAGLSPHILLGLYNEERDRFAKLAKLALDAGIDEREVRVLERQGALFADLVRRLLDDPSLGLTDEQRQRGRQIAAGHLRLLPA